MANAIQEEMGMENEDWILMQQVAQGKETALRTLYDRFGNLVFRNACQVLGSVSEAEDATQEVFVQIWKTSERYDPTRSKLITWVMLISRRMFIDRLRRRMVRPNSISLDEGCTTLLLWILRTMKLKRAVPPFVAE